MKAYLSSDRLLELEIACTSVMVPHIDVVLYNYAISCLTNFTGEAKKHFRKVCIARRPTKIISKDAENLGGCEFEIRLTK